jgi:transcriptional regulator with XRE-family HTH domain
MKIIRTKRKNPLAAAFAKPLSIEAQIEQSKLTVVEELLQFMKREGISRSELAQRLDVRPSRITAMLNGTGNLTIDTLVRAGLAVGADLAQTYVPRGQRGHWVPATPRGSQADNSIAVDFTPRHVYRAPTPALASNQPASRDAEDAA